MYYSIRDYEDWKDTEGHEIDTASSIEEAEIIIDSFDEDSRCHIGIEVIKN